MERQMPPTIITVLTVRRRYPLLVLLETKGDQQLRLADSFFDDQRAAGQAEYAHKLNVIEPEMAFALIEELHAPIDMAAYKMKRPLALAQAVA